MKKYLVLLLLFSCHSAGDLDKSKSGRDSNQAATKQELDLSKRVKFQEKINFAYDSSSISADARKVLVDNTIWLLQNPKKDVTVEGHCDERGTREYNLALGERRAHAVKNFFVDSGVEKKRVKTVSYGEEKPESVGSTEKAYAKNRRAEFAVK